MDDKGAEEQLVILSFLLWVFRCWRNYGQ